MWQRSADVAASREDRALQLLSERTALPIWSARKALVELISSNSTVILVGETGSGKTTQAPQLVELQMKPKGVIACTQPRRIAAITVAQRVAEEQGVLLGSSVGFAVRFENKSGVGTRIKYMTDGLLIREAITDPQLRTYSVIFVDEAHERTINTDVLVGLLKQAQQVRDGSADPLKLVVMSATLDFSNFLRFFPGSCPAYVQGRQYAVEVFHTAKAVDSYLKAAVDTVMQERSLPCLVYEAHTSLSAQAVPMDYRCIVRKKLDTCWFSCQDRKKSKWHTTRCLT